MSNIKIQCRYIINGQRQCLNDALEGSVTCSPHSKKAIVYTPGGQKVFRSGGSLDLGPKLAKERDWAIPENSAGIEGFPYTTADDLEAYRLWKTGQSPTIDSHDILDRFPLEVRDIAGSDLNGTEVAIYDSYGAVWELAKDDRGQSIILEESTELDGLTTTLYQTKSGHPFAVLSTQTYQIVRLDEDILNRSIISSI